MNKWIIVFGVLTAISIIFILISALYDYKGDEKKKKEKRLYLIYSTASAILSALIGLGTFIYDHYIEDIAVPNLIQLSVYDAEIRLDSYGLNLSIKEDWCIEVEEGYIFSQNPLEGTIVKKGRRISVVVSKGEEPPKMTEPETINPDSTDDDSAETGVTSLEGPKRTKTTEPSTEDVFVHNETTPAPPSTSTDAPAATTTRPPTTTAIPPIATAKMQVAAVGSGYSDLSNFSYDSIYVSAGLCDVVLTPTNGSPYVEYFLPNKSTLSVSETNGTLSVIENRTSSISISINETHYIRLHLPNKQFETIRIETSSGEIASSVLTGSLRLITSSGDMSATNILSLLDIKTSSGDANVAFSNSSSGGSITLKSSSGDLAIGLPESYGFNLDYKTSSGNIRYTISGQTFTIDNKGSRASHSGNKMYAIMLDSSSGDLSIF